MIERLRFPSRTATSTAGRKGQGTAVSKAGRRVKATDTRAHTGKAPVVTKATDTGKATAGADDKVTHAAADYAVGYKKPPLHTRFKPGRSGNPAGREKGLRNLATDVRRTLAKPVKIKEDGRVRKRSTQESLLMVLREKALRGDQRALERGLDLARHFNNDAETTAASALPEEDKAILAAYAADHAPTTTQGVSRDEDCAVATNGSPDDCSDNKASGQR